MAKRKNNAMIVTNVTNPNDPYLQVICGVKDLKAGVFIEMGAVTNTGVAIRAFADQINRNEPNNNLYRWPDDFAIYQLGIYNPRTGELKGSDVPVVLAEGISVKVR